MHDALTTDDTDELGNLLASVASGDRAAFEELYHVTSRRLFPIVRRIVGERELAEDVLQEIYLTIWRKAGQYDRRRGSPFSWIAAIARNRAIDRLRRDSCRPREDVALDDADDGIEILFTQAATALLRHDA
jgi:RNA polymerase sigma-70 factor (ECF subfamily)